MKFKKQKRHRKIVRFYTACFGFREPFKVLCDGTFVHHLFANKITPLDTALTNTLGATVKIFTTKCVLAELRSFGPSFSESLNTASSLLTARCDHEKRKSAVACISDVMGENNPEHFYVASQDAELRKKFQKVPGVPIIFALRNALFLDPPSDFQHQFIKSAEEERLHMSELEYKMLNMKKKRVNVEEAGVSDTDEDVGDEVLVTQDVKTNTSRKPTDLKDKIQFKRKKAKGPNPLSCKKKKAQGNQNRVPRKDDGGKDGDETVRSRGRKRKRSRKSKTLVLPQA